jgi:hypothetical protein
MWNPHEEMEKCVKMYDNNTLVQSAVNTMKEFIKGGEITVDSKDIITKKRAQYYMDSLNVDEWIDEVIENCIKTGNAYAEIDWQDAQWKIPYKIYPIADSSRIYINCNEYGQPITKKVVEFDPITKRQTTYDKPNEEEYYIQRINENIRNPNAKYYQLSYNIGSSYQTKRIYGIPINKRKMIHFRLNLGNTGMYGRAYIASALDDEEILKQIERSIAIIAKYKAVPRDIITYGDKENPSTDDEMNEFIIYLESLEKGESAITNKPIQRQSLSWAGQDINLDYMIKHVNKKLIAGIAPDFMMGLGDQVNKATAQISLISYILAIYSKRHLFLKPLEKYLLKPFLAREGLEPATLKFGELDFETKSEKTNRVGAMWTQNVITLNRYLELMNEAEIGDRGDVYYMEWQKELGGDQFGFPNFGGMDNNAKAGNSLPNGEPIDKMFTHNEPDNKNNVQQGGKMPFDTEQDVTNIPKTLPKKDLQKPGKPLNEEYSSAMKEMKDIDDKIMNIINSKEKNFEDKKNEINEMKSSIEDIEKELSEYDKIKILSDAEVKNDINEQNAEEIVPEYEEDKIIKKSNEKIHIIIDNDKEESEDKNMKTKKITYKSLITNFETIFREPRTTEIYYKKNNDGWTVSFMKNNVLIYCEVSESDIINTNLLNMNKKAEEMNSEEKEGLIQAWKNKYLYKAIEEI